MKHHPNIGKSTALYTIGLVSFFLSLHVALPSYFNSSFLTQFTSEENLSFIYIVQSMITILGLLSMHKILRKFGNYRTALFLIGIQILLLYGIINFKAGYLLIPLIILSISLINLISFNLDIFLEKNSDTNHTGTIRGHYLTVSNSAWILGPLLAGMIIADSGYKGIYVAAFGLLFPVFYLIYRNFPKFKDPHYPKISLIKSMIILLNDKDLSKLTVINTVLQTFYSWMTIYTPIYLYKSIGFDWTEISIILTIMLVPFVLIETPLGKLADKKYGEKEIMAIGYIIMGISTILLSFITVKSLAIWAILLFITRIGAAASEAMIETYFFKKVDVKDSEILSMFRITRPLSFFIAPLITVTGLMFVSNTYLFIIIGALCIITVAPIALIKDTR
jgi:MFS family permease